MLIYLFLLIEFQTLIFIFFQMIKKKKNFGLWFNPKNQTQVTTYVTATTGA